MISPTSVASSNSFGSLRISRPSAPGLSSMFEADLEEVFFNANEFAESIEIYYAREGTNDTITVIFDEEYQDVNFEDLSVAGKTPLLTVQSSELQRALEKGDWVRVRGVAYSVIPAQPDGTGVTEIMLERK